MMRRLYDASVAKHKVWVSVAGGGHNDTWRKGASMEAIAKFVRTPTAGIKSQEESDTSK